MAGTFVPGPERPGALSARAYPDDPPLDWVVVGGGIHGTYLSNFLIQGMGESLERLKVLDPNPEILSVWKRFTENVGMSSLRSAAVHHLDLASLSLKRFALSGDEERSLDVPRLAPPYGRPALLLFNRHCEEVVRRNRLDAVRITGEASGLKLAPGGFEVAYGGGYLHTRRVLLAIGMSDQPCWPAWTEAARSAGARVHHVLDAGFARRKLSGWKRAIVVGGGLSGAQVALALAKERPGSVTLVARRSLEVHLFDSEPSWQGQNFMRSFASEPDPERRREIITAERHRGSLTPEAMRDVDAASASGALRVIRAEDELEVKGRARGRLVAFRAGGEELRADLVILATGFDRKRPGGPWLDRAVEELRLPVGPCGFPVVSPGLEWRPGLYVTGPLAELELGPVARNISGAHRAAARLDFYAR